MNRKTIILITIILLTLNFAVTAQATSTLDSIRKAAGESGDEGIITQVDQTVGNTIKTARVLTVIILVVLILILGGLLIFGGQRALTAVKVLAVVIIIGVFFVFKTESLVATLLNLVGYKP